MTNENLRTKIETLRTNFKANDDRRDAGLATTVTGVQRIDNLSYGPDPRWHLLDLYLPTNVSGPIPTIINIHGGGWCYGTKETYQFFGLSWAQRGFAFVNANYRLAPDVVFPGELDDVDRYVHWVAAHADEYGLDPNNVILMGDSAGGQMAEQYATILTNPTYRHLFDYQLTNLKFRALALNSAAVFVLDPGMITDAVTAYFSPEIVAQQRDRLTTEAYLEAPFLPTIICTATADFLRNNSAKLDGFLTAKKIPHQFQMFGTPDDPRGHVFLVDQKDAFGRQANDEQAAFFRRYLVK